MTTTRWLNDNDLSKQLEQYKASRVKQTVHQLVDGKCVSDILRDVVQIGVRELEGELSPN